MKKKLYSFSDILEKVTLWVIIAILLVMIVIAWAHVFSRYFFNHALSWSEEVLRFMLVWFALLSASIIFKRKAHIGIVIFVQKLSEEMQKKVEELIYFLFLFCCIITTYQGFDLAIRVGGQLSPATRISMTIPYLSIPISFLLMAIYDFIHIIQRYDTDFVEKDMFEDEYAEN